MVEFAAVNAFSDCWCGCKAERHKLELSAEKLVHTRCNRCRCTQYEPREDLAPDVAAATAERFGELAEVEQEAPGPRPILDAVPAAVVDENRDPRADVFQAEPDPEVTPAAEGGPIEPDSAVEPSAPALLTCPAHGEVLESWRSWRCSKGCGARRFESFKCCGAAAEPVTVTMTRGHGG